MYHFHVYHHVSSPFPSSHLAPGFLVPRCVRYRDTDFTGWCLRRFGLRVTGTNQSEGTRQWEAQPATGNGDTPWKRMLKRCGCHENGFLKCRDLKMYAVKSDFAMIVLSEWWERETNFSCPCHDSWSTLQGAALVQGWCDRSLCAAP